MPGQHLRPMAHYSSTEADMEQDFSDHGEGRGRRSRVQYCEEKNERMGGFDSVHQHQSIGRQNTKEWAETAGP